MDLPVCDFLRTRQLADEQLERTGITGWHGSMFLGCGGSQWQQAFTVATQCRAPSLHVRLLAKIDAIHPAKARGMERALLQSAKPWSISAHARCERRGHDCYALVGGSIGLGRRWLSPLHLIHRRLGKLKKASLSWWCRYPYFPDNQNDISPTKGDLYAYPEGNTKL